MVVEFNYNECMERYDVQLPFVLGDMKDMQTVAHIAKMNPHLYWNANDQEIKICVLNDLTIPMVRAIINRWEDFKVNLDRNPLDDLDSRKEQEFEPYPDGENHVQG